MMSSVVPKVKVEESVELHDLANGTNAEEEANNPQMPPRSLASTTSIFSMETGASKRMDSSQVIIITEEGSELQSSANNSSAQDESIPHRSRSRTLNVTSLLQDVQVQMRARTLVFEIGIAGYKTRTGKYV